MVDTDPNFNEINEEIDSLLGDIITEEVPENKDLPISESQSGETRDSSANSTAECILDILLADARMPISEIADQADVSEPTVRKYIDQLESEDIIIGYSVETDPKKLTDQTTSLVRIEIDGAVIEEVTAALFAMEAVHSLFLLKEETGAMAEIRADGFMKLGEIIKDDISAIDGVKEANTTILEERHD